MQNSRFSTSQDVTDSPKKEQTETCKRCAGEAGTRNRREVLVLSMQTIFVVTVSFINSHGGQKVTTPWLPSLYLTDGTVKNSCLIVTTQTSQRANV